MLKIGMSKVKKSEPAYLARFEVTFGQGENFQKMYEFIVNLEKIKWQNDKISAWTKSQWSKERKCWFHQIIQKCNLVFLKTKLPMFNVSSLAG